MKDNYDYIRGYVRGVQACRGQHLRGYGCLESIPEYLKGYDDGYSDYLGRQVRADLVELVR